MDFNAIITPILEFFSTGVGKLIAGIFKALYSVFFPANAPAASVDVVTAADSTTAAAATTSPKK
ncbi:hypothetical protein [Corynebacterium sp. HS2168-gen11]|uniref:hypothetical protein n=1 Tax=Corynebacterium sp. HS2168-gen11 TaxID=2974027 RepID=UPI00216AFFEC|nr:hypothetical protein [Corynebacterium sp. HS2168-gen11]MCS4536478.1 hypothetical protein [Corynebacterium sp. HS2168-gen11]